MASSAVKRLPVKQSSLARLRKYIQGFKMVSFNFFFSWHPKGIFFNWPLRSLHLQIVPQFAHKMVQNLTIILLQIKLIQLNHYQWPSIYDGHSLDWQTVHTFSLILTSFQWQRALKLWTTKLDPYRASLILVTVWLMLHRLENDRVHITPVPPHNGHFPLHPRWLCPTVSKFINNYNYYSI